MLQRASVTQFRAYSRKSKCWKIQSSHVGTPIHSICDKVPWPLNAKVSKKRSDRTFHRMCVSLGSTSTNTRLSFLRPRFWPSLLRCFSESVWHKQVKLVCASLWGEHQQILDSLPWGHQSDPVFLFAFSQVSVNNIDRGTTFISLGFASTNVMLVLRSPDFRPFLLVAYLSPIDLDWQNRWF